MRRAWTYDDGGREAAGYKGLAGDCACRAIAIAGRLDYQQVYDELNRWAGTERPGSKSRSGRRSSARDGVFAATMRRMLDEWGWPWTATMEVGSGCRVHLRGEELPKGRLVARVSKHYVAVVDGVVHDTHDPTRGGTRCVYGYWRAS